MSLDLTAVKRFGRHLALPDIGAEGQERILAATIALVGDDPALEAAARYLSGAGGRRFRVVSRDPARAQAVERAMRLTAAQVTVDRTPWPDSGPAWVTALEGTNLVVRTGFEDDPMLRAAVRLGIPAVVLRALSGEIDLLAFRKHGPCPHASLEIPPRAQDDSRGEGAPAIVAGTLAATEGLWILARPGDGPRARHLRLPLTGEDPITQEFPWSPECFLCGGSGREAVFS